MTITITKISKSEWGKVGKVFLWLVLSGALAGVTALATSDKNYLATMPMFNIVIVALSQLFQSEETQAQVAIPTAIKPEVDQLVAEVEKKIPPTPPQVGTTPGN
jgi:hypothetical protein